MKTFYKALFYSVLCLGCIVNSVKAQTATFSQTYTNAAASTAQCAAWNTFVTTLSSSGNYVKMTISGTYDATGISCTDKTIITAFVAAIKNNTTYISGTTSGHVWSICNRYAGEIWLDPPASCSGSNCPSPGYIIRPCIGGTNSNWGGVNTATCGAPTQVMTIKFEMPTKPNDAGISAITTPLCAPDLVVTYNNHGTNAIDSAKINWSVNGTMQTQNRYNTTVAQGGKPVNITLTPTYNFIDGDNYTVKVWTSLPNNKYDSVPSNDTFKISFKYQGPAGTPGVKDVIKCGPGRAPLVATPAYQGDSIYWFNAATGNNVIARGKNTLSPPLVLGVNTFYAQAFKMSSPQKLGNTLSGTTYYSTAGFSGGMFNITPKNDLVIDSFTTRLVNFTTGQTFSVYYKTGTYVGSETNAGAWTLLAGGVVGRVVSVSGKNLAYVKIPELPLTKGITYGFYLTTTNAMTNYIYMTSATNFTVSDNEMTYFSDRMVYGAALFTTIGASYNMDMEVNYRKQSCPSSRVPVVVTVKPSPAGGAFIKGSPFQSTMPNTLGTKGNPDIVAKGDILSYEITPPTGYTNSGYGSTWIMSNFTFRTQSGRVLSTAYYTPTNPAPSGSNNAKVSFTADDKIVDSTIIMTVSLQDLGPWYCDSSLTRYIFVAPRPVADFRFVQPVCDGDNVIFTNTSTISSGNILYKWDFATGNPADTSASSDIVFKFPTHGTYNVKLTTKSFPYGYTDSKTIPVVVTEIPKIGFKVFNACLGDEVSFVNSTTISQGLITYKWDFGNGSSSTVTNPKIKYPNAGSYRVTLTATSNGCSQTLTKNAWEFARPVAKFSFPKVLCDKTEIQFTNGSTITTGNMGYRWTFSDGGTSTATNPLHAFAFPGIKQAKMKVISEFGCADSLTQNLDLAEAPLANFTYGPVCNLSNTNFTFTGTKPGGTVATVFNWDFGGEGSTSIENPSKQLKIIGKKPVTLTVTSNNGCSDVITKVIEVKLQSKADFTVADVCDGESAIFVNNSSVSSGNLSYLWKFGDATNSSSQAPRHMYASGSQTYNVTLVAIVPGGCSDSITKPVSVNATPSSDFTYQTSGRLVSYKASQPGNTTYHWNFGDGANSDLMNAQYHYLNSFEYGRFVACLLVENAAGCFSQTCKEIVITGGIDKISKDNGVRIYPNPNKGNFTISVEDPKSDISIVIYNILGEMVKTIEANSLTSVYPVEMESANGIYLIKVTNGGLVSTQKISIKP